MENEMIAIAGAVISWFTSFWLPLVGFILCYTAGIFTRRFWDKHTGRREKLLSSIEDAVSDFAKDVEDFIDDVDDAMDEAANPQEAMNILKSKQDAEREINYTLNGENKQGTEGILTYEEIREAVYPENKNPEFCPSCTWMIKNGGAGILYKGKKVKIVEGINITMVDTSNA